MSKSYSKITSDTQLYEKVVISLDIDVIVTFFSQMFLQFVTEKAMSSQREEELRKMLQTTKLELDSVKGVCVCVYVCVCVCV